MRTSASSSLVRVLALVLVFTVVGCAAPAASSKASPAPPTSAAGLSRTGAIVPMGDLENLSTRLEALEGQVVLIDFWATWCPPCRVSLPYYDRWQQALGQKGLTVMAISVDTPDVDLRSFVREKTELLFDAAGAVLEERLLESLGGIEPAA